jgi:hypothetical protein
MNGSGRKEGKKGEVQIGRQISAKVKVRIP